MKPPIVYEDETTDGGRVYLAVHAELYGCMAQGDTRESAIEALEDATAEYLESLVEDHLSIEDVSI